MKIEVDKNLFERQGDTQLLCPAKLNISLRIVGRRQDEYHLLDSLFWPINYCDEIFVSPSKNWKFETEWHGEAPFPTPLPSEEKNLLARGFKLLDPAPSVAVRLVKRIPMGAGLGGGSSNVGALLRWLLELMPEKEKDIRRVAEGLGADVPFFLDPTPSLISGVGEKSTLFGSPLKPGFLVVFLPRPQLTADIFAAYKRSGMAFSQRETLLPDFSNAGNDLESVCSLDYPLVGEVLQELRETPCLYAGVSGSGSTCFAVFSDTSTAQENANALGSFLRKRNCESVSVGTFS